MVLVEKNIIDAKCRRLLYSGTLIVLRQLPSLVELSKLAEKKIIRPSLTDAEVQNLISFYENDETVSNLFVKALVEAGVDPEVTFWDRLRLRIQLPGGKVDKIADNKYGTGRFSATLPLHRDTWASNISSQLNWWAPLAPIDKNRTLQIFPSYISKPVTNSSRNWSMKSLREKRKAGQSYPQMPVCEASGKELEEIQSDAFSVVIEPGDLLVFSSAHLHMSVPNTTSLPRFSTEVRTVDSVDFSNKIGAVNVDGDAQGLQRKWFKRISTAESEVNEYL